MPLSKRSASLPLLLLACAAMSASAQECPAESAQFDFWIGEWSVRQEIRTPDGRWIEFPARSDVTAAAGGCALVERWSGEAQFFWQGMQEPAWLEGLSVRAFDADDGVWKIWWLDSRSPDFGAPFTGRFHDGVGTFTRTTIRPTGAPLTGPHPIQRYHDGVGQVGAVDPRRRRDLDAAMDHAFFASRSRLMPRAVSTRSRRPLHAEPPEPRP